MNISHLLKEEIRLKELIKSEYVHSVGNSLPIYDGIVNPQLYLQSKRRILWVLKEPYDNGEKYNDARDGGWSLTDDCMNNQTDMTSRKRAFQPICYINYGIWSEVHDWNEMPWLRNCEEMRNGLKNIAFINISKLPGLKHSPWRRIVEAYERHRRLIIDQINSYAPHIIFACNPHANLLLKDFGYSESKWTPFGSAASIRLSSEQRLVWIGHPSSRTKRAPYVNDAIRAATSKLD